MIARELSARWEDKLDRDISCLKYTLFCLHFIGLLCGVTMFGVAIWVRSDEGLEEWVSVLDLYEFYAGIYILIFGGAVIMITAVLGCFSAITERRGPLQVFIGTQIVAFILNLAGAAVLLDHATYQSSIQPLIRRSMLRLINYSQYEDVSRKLNSVQETIGCCGADGPNDYINLRRALPTECRDTVTGNAYFYGCVDELTWFLEEKGAWLAGLAMFLCLFNVVSIVLSTVLIHVVRREEKQQELMQGYRRN